jgi:predicted  nucleic acid-binding Zn-ribbon protein
MTSQKHMLEKEDEIFADQRQAKNQLTSMSDILSTLRSDLKKTSKELHDVSSKQQEIIERFNEEDRQAAEQAAAGARRGRAFFGGA